VQFATGHRVDLDRLGAACRERGIYFVVDAIQGLGALTLDVARTHVDILACGAQKWLLSPWGTGFVYVRPGLVRQLEPQAVGWMATVASEDFGSLVDYNPAWLPDARRFEVITLPFQEFAGLNASLELLLELGPQAVAAHIARLTGRIVEWAGSHRGVALVTSADPLQRGGIVTVRPPDVERVVERLIRAKVSVAVREGGIRLAPHCYNTHSDVDTALSAIEGATPATR
jgi:selenocysteine lyase/cysteine desulfurase